MRPSILTAPSLLLVAASACAASDGADPIRLTVAWNVKLDAQGHVTQLDPIANARADRVPKIRERIEQEIRGWSFVPGAVDGVPAATDTILSTTVTLQPGTGDSFRIIFDDARTGGRIGKTVFPKYPLAAVKRHETGMVVLRVDYDADGKVRSAAVDPASPASAQRLVDASLEAVRQWTFQPERVAGHGVPGSQSLPVCFSLSLVGSHAAIPPCEWNAPGKHAPIGEGESVALNPAARLVNDVAGHAL